MHVAEIRDLERMRTNGKVRDRHGSLSINQVGIPQHGRAVQERDLARRQDAARGQLRHGKSSYLIFSKYNNYAGYGGGDGINQITVLDPYATEPDPHADNDPALLVMNEVLTMAGPTPDLGFVQGGLPDAVREWCINDTVVDPSTKSILVNSEDGNIYRWNLATDTLTQAVHLTPGVGDPYTPTLIGPGGIVYVINGGILFALGGFPKYTLTNLASINPAYPGQPVTFTTTVTPRNLGVTPTGTITFEDGANVLATLTLTNGQASFTTSFHTQANHFITALYNGDGNYPAGSTELVESVRHSDIAVLATSANPSIFSQSI
jgi:Bacterial Ig-like domain (group 3)